MRWGDEDVAVETKPWRAASDVNGYRQTYKLMPGDRWIDAPLGEGQYENLVATDDGPLPVGLAIARELVNAGASWAVMVELWGGLVLVNHEGVCVPLDGEVGQLLTVMRRANGGRWGGFADVVGLRGHRVIVREAKVAGGRDRLRPNQHQFLRAMRQHFGSDLDAAVVQWDTAKQ